MVLARLCPSFTEMFEGQHSVGVDAGIRANCVRALLPVSEQPMRMVWCEGYCVRTSALLYCLATIVRNLPLWLFLAIPVIVTAGCAWHAGHQAPCNS